MYIEGPAASKEMQSKENDDECPICRSDFDLPIKTSCGHKFCGGCFLSCWNFVKEHINCPYCRSPVNQVQADFSIDTAYEDFERRDKVARDLKQYNLGWGVSEKKLELVRINGISLLKSFASQFSRSYINDVLTQVLKRLRASVVGHLLDPRWVFLVFLAANLAMSLLMEILVFVLGYETTSSLLPIPLVRLSNYLFYIVVKILLFLCTVNILTRWGTVGFQIQFDIM